MVKNTIQNSKMEFYTSHIKIREKTSNLTTDACF